MNVAVHKRLVPAFREVRLFDKRARDWLSIDKHLLSVVIIFLSLR